MAVRRKWRWVSRNDYEDGYVEVWMGETKPLNENGYYWQSGRDCVNVCPEEFAALFGFQIKPKTCRKVEFSARLVPTKAVKR